MFRSQADIFSGSKSAKLKLICGKLNSKGDAYKNSVFISSEHNQDANKTYVVKLDSLLPNQKPTYYPVIFKDDVGRSEILMSATIRANLGYVDNIQKAIPSVHLSCLEQKNIKQSQKVDVYISKIVTDDGSMLDESSIDAADLANHIKDNFKKYPLYLNQALVVNYKNAIIFLSIKSFGESLESKDSVAQSGFSSFDENTKIDFSLHAKCQKKYVLKNNKPLTITLDFVDKGIGGHKNELSRFVREAFYSRALGGKYLDAYGINHTKGVLLYGPPGTGKTLIARQIGAMFTKNVKIINGPELKNKYVGQSQENLRKIFEDADREWCEKGKQSSLHVFIFDEIDALVPRRGSRSGGTGVDDDMVTTLLTMLDGVNSPKNILIIGLTNRKDLLDPAILRPGRLAAHIEIGLPDLKARKEILQIATKKMTASGVLDKDVDLDYWAEKTENFTGAEIVEQLVKNATQFAMINNFSEAKKELVRDSRITRVEHLAKVKTTDFEKSFSEIIPLFGVNTDEINIQTDKFIIHSINLKNIVDDFKLNFNMLVSDNQTSHLSYLLEGEGGIGKTELAKYLAFQAGVKNIRIIDSNKLLQKSPSNQFKFIDQEFHDAMQSNLSVIILDEIENLVEATVSKFQCNDRLRLKLLSKLKQSSHPENKCIIIATTQDKDYINKLGFGALFNESQKLGNVKLLCSNINDVEILSKIFAMLGFENKFKPLKEHGSKQVIDLSMRNLIHKIRKFSSTRSIYDLGEFYEFISPAQYLPSPTEEKVRSGHKLFGIG